jgi:hypothetical protein
VPAVFRFGREWQKANTLTAPERPGKHHATIERDLAHNAPDNAAERTAKAEAKRERALGNLTSSHLSLFG